MKGYLEKRLGSLASYGRSPINVLVLAGLFAAILIGISLFYTLHQPWLGLSFVENDAKGLLVATVDPDGPSATIIASGDTLSSIRGVRTSWLALDRELLIEDPDMLSSFSEWRKLLYRERMLYQTMKSPVVYIQLDDGREVRVQPARMRPLSSLSFSYLALHLIALIALMVGAGIYSMQMVSLPVRLLFISGIGFAVAASSAAFYISRELAINPEQFYFFTALNHLGIFTYAVSGLGLLWHYPRSLNAWPMTRILTIFMLFVWVNEQSEWLEWPVHSYYFPFAILFILAAGFGLTQWIQSHNKPVDRAALKWVLLSVFFSITTIMLLYFIPGMLIFHSLLPITWSFAAALIMYLGFVLGVVRYRLFDIERWWLNIWLWFVAGLVVIAIDTIIGLLLPQLGSYTTPLAIILTGWVYFPLRQWIWRHLFANTQRDIGQFLPALVMRMINREADDSEKWWGDVLTETFNPMHLSRVPAMDAVHLQDHGGKLLVPSIHGQDTFELCYAEQGRRLFLPEDVKIVRSLMEIVRRTEQQLDSYARGMAEERRRIMRDLHDEVGGQLLTLVHQSVKGQQSELASSALSALREVIYSMDEKEPVDYEMAFSRWRILARERCESAGIKLQWPVKDNMEEGLFTNRQYYNINLAFKESLTNALKHKGTSDISVLMNISNASFQAEIQNNLGQPISGELQPGKGLHNMRLRIQEIGGQFNYQVSKECFLVNFFVPLDDANKGK